MQDREILTDGNILSDLLEAEILRHKKATEGNKYRIGSFLMYAVVIGILSKTLWIGLLISLGSVYHAVVLAGKIKEHESNMASLRRGGFTVDTDFFSHISDESIVEPHLGGLSRSKKMTRYKRVTYFCFDNCRFRLCFFKGFGWSRKYYMSPGGLKNISIAGDEFYVAVRACDGEVGQIYPKKIFEYKREGEK
jgi:hypothetical protein